MSSFQNLTIKLPLLKEKEITNKKNVSTKYILLQAIYFIRLVQNQISFTFCCQHNNKCRREIIFFLYNVGQFVQKRKNSIFVIFIRLFKIRHFFKLLQSTQ